MESGCHDFKRNGEKVTESRQCGLQRHSEQVTESGCHDLHDEHLVTWSVCIIYRDTVNRSWNVDILIYRNMVNRLCILDVIIYRDMVNRSQNLDVILHRHGEKVTGSG